MQQKSQQTTPRPNSIRLQPFSLLPQLRPYSLTSPTNHTQPFPVISRGKIKTEASCQGKERTRIKTEPNMIEKEEASPSFRLISRFIYNHLQKKINFQTQLYKNYQNAYPSYQSQSPTSDQAEGLQLIPLKGNKYQYGYERYNPTLKDSNHTQILKFKNKLSLKQKILQRNHTKSPNPKHRYANIDSYFDLSCLDTCTPKQHSF